MVEICPSDKDPLKWPAPKKRPSMTSRRIGIHTSIAGGVENAAERASRLGCNTFQIFSSSPRQWQPYSLGRLQCEVMNDLRQKYDLKPLVIHSNYLINSERYPPFLEKSVPAFRGELERGLSASARTTSSCIPGSFPQHKPRTGLVRARVLVAEACQVLDLDEAGLTILIGAPAAPDSSLGGTFEQVANYRDLYVGPYQSMRASTPATRMSRIDIVSDEGRQRYSICNETVGETCACGIATTRRQTRAHLDRHEHIGAGRSSGWEVCRRC